jgi:hypothetical protein
MLLMFVLGYPYERAYAPMATVGFIILAMALDALLARWQWARLLAVVLCLVLSAVAYPPEIKVLHDLKQFEDHIASEIRNAPRQAVLREYRFVGSNHFATPLRYVSSEYFNRESTYRAFFDKDNVQFVSDSVYERFHSQRLLDGARVLPMVSDRPEIADTVLGFPDQFYMIVLVKGDTLPASPQIAIYHLSDPNIGLTPEERQKRKNYALDADFVPCGFYPLFYQGRQVLVFPLINDVTSSITFQLDNDNELGEMTLTPQREHWMH